MFANRLAPCNAIKTSFESSENKPNGHGLIVFRLLGIIHLIAQLSSTRDFPVRY